MRRGRACRCSRASRASCASRSGRAGSATIRAELATLLRTAGQGALPPVWDRLGEIACPALFVAGEGDDAYVQVAYRMSESVGNGKARLVPGTGHAPQLERPEAFAGVLTEFLEDAATPSRA